MKIAPLLSIAGISKKNDNELPPFATFGILWLLTLAMYIITAKAGWVTDTIDWQQKVKEASFWDYINITQTRVPSLYQFTQFTTYLLYQLFGVNRWAWFLLTVSMHAANATLIYQFVKTLLQQSGNKSSSFIALGSMVLFTVAPHISEVLVWKASFHYLQGSIMLMAIVRWSQQFQTNQNPKYVIASLTVFSLSMFALEFAYLTPWFVLTLALYYRYILDYNSAIFKKTMLWFFAPLMAIFAIHLLILHIVTGAYAAHLGEDIIQPAISYLRKPPTYVFHNLLLGRFFPTEVRKTIYLAFRTVQGVVFFYGAIAYVWLFLIYRFKKLSVNAKTALLFFIWLQMCIAIVSPVWISEDQLVAYDRYSYFMLPWMYVLIMMALAAIPARIAGTAIFATYAAVNGYFTYQINTFWRQSGYINNRLVTNMPPVGNKTVLFLNLPANMNGIPMIGSLPNSAFKLLYNVNHEQKLDNKMYDVVSYNMQSAKDGAHVLVVNDTLIQVTLNQWGAWWWYGNTGATSYENEAYKVVMRDPGHWYELILKHPADQYALLFQTSDEWRVVNMQKRDDKQY